MRLLGSTTAGTLPEIIRAGNGRRRGRGRIAALALLLLVPGLGQAGEPYRPERDEVVLERLPAPNDVNLRQLTALRRQLAQNPKDLDLAVRLARRYTELGSTEADPRYYAYAKAALTPWWELERPPVDVRLLRAHFLQHQHQFEPALADLAAVLEQDPRNVEAWLTRAMILRAQGRYDEAAASCSPLLTAADPVITGLCLTSINSLRGRLDGSYRQLLRLVERPLEPAHAQWAYTTLAQMAEQRGESAAAAEHYRQAMAVDRRDIYLLGAYADFLLLQGQPQQVRELLADETQVDSLLLRLAIAERRLELPVWKQHADLLAERFRANQWAGRDAHLRELARFRLDLQDKPQAALAAALDNWTSQREPEDARLLLRAAAAANEPAAAEHLLQWLAQTELEDLRLPALNAPAAEVSR
jgi:Tfp pilus assembly protein PilF